MKMFKKLTGNHNKSRKVKATISLALLAALALTAFGCNRKPRYIQVPVPVNSEVPSDPSKSEVPANSETPADPSNSETPADPSNSETPAAGEEQLPPRGNIGGIEYSISQCDYFQKSKKPGYYIDTLDEPNAPYFFFITSGRKNTGGYGVEIVNIEVDENKNMVVTVEFTSPKLSDVVTQAITYPCAQLTVSEYPASIVIKTTGGLELPCLN